MAIKVIARRRDIDTVSELHEALSELTVHKLGDVTYVRSGNGNRLLLELEEETLTDGSLVYNLIVREVVS